MHTTVRTAINDAARLIGELVMLPPDTMVEVDDQLTWGFRKRFYNRRLFDPIQTDTYLNEGEIVYFDYVDRDGERSSRVAYVVDPEAYGQNGRAVLTYDLDKEDYRMFVCDRMSNIYYLLPVPA
jgi:predicted DNA-binding transcriptional regulator YafY